MCTFVLKRSFKNEVTQIWTSSEPSPPCFRLKWLFNLLFYALHYKITYSRLPGPTYVNYRTFLNAPLVKIKITVYWLTCGQMVKQNKTSFKLVSSLFDKPCHRNQDGRGLSIKAQYTKMDSCCDPSCEGFYLCCVFRPVNGCSAHRSLVEINFLTLKQLFAYFLVNKSLILLTQVSNSLYMRNK